MRQAEAGFVDTGMFRLLDALRLAPADARDFRRVIRANLAALGARLPMSRQVLPNQRNVCLVGLEGVRFATLTADGRVQIWLTATGEPVGPPSVRLKLHRLIGVLSDGRRALIQEEEAGTFRMRLRDLATGAAVGPALHGGGSGITTDERFAWASRPSDPLDARRNRTEFLDVAAGKLVGPPVEEDFRLLRGRDGRAVLMTFPTRDYDSPPNPSDRARFRDLLTGKDLARVELDPAGGDAWARFNGSAILTTDADSTVRWWDPITGKAARPAWRPERASRRTLCHVLTADARTLIVYSNDNRLRWYEIATGRESEAALTLPADPKEGLALSPDGMTVLTSSVDGATRLWQVFGGAWLPGRPGFPAAGYIELAADTGCRTLALTSRGQASYACLVHAATGAALAQPLDDFNKYPTFSADGSLLASATRASRRYAPAARVWDVATGTPRTPPLPTRSYIHGLAFSPDQRTLAVGAIGGTVLYDVATGKPGPILRQTAPVSSLTYSRDGRWLATGSRHGWTNLASTWCVWRIANHRAVGPPVPTADAALFAFAPDDHTLLALDLVAGRLRHWDVATSHAPDEGFLLHPGRKISRAVFRADTARLLTGYADGTAQQWDTATGQPIGAPLRHASPVSALAFSPDGGTLAVGGEDGTVVLWDAVTALPLGPPLVHAFGVLDVGFTPDGATARTVTADGAVLFWPIAVAVPDDPEQLTAWVRAATGAHAEGDRVVPDEPADWNNARTRLAELWPEAATALRRPLDVASADNRLARQAEADGDRFAARWHLDRLIATAPSLPLYLRRAAVHASAGRPSDAEADFHRAAELAGPKALLPELRRHAHEARARQDWRTALIYLDHLTTRTPDDWHVYAGRAEVQGHLGKPAERLADRKRAVRLGAEPPVVSALVDDYAAQGCWHEALNLLASRGQLSLGQSHLLALLLIKTDNQAGYRKLCRKALDTATKLAPQRDPSSLNAVLWLCALRPGATDNYTEAIRFAEQALAQVPATAAPERADVLNTLGALLYRSGRDREARDRLQQAIATRDGQGVASDWVFLALACHRLGRVEETRAWLDRLRKTSDVAAEFSWSAVEMRLLRDEVERTIAGVGVHGAEGR